MGGSREYVAVASLMDARRRISTPAFVRPDEWRIDGSTRTTPAVAEGPTSHWFERHPVAGDPRERVRAGKRNFRHAAEGCRMAHRHRGQRVAVHGLRRQRHRRSVRYTAAA